MVCRLVFVSSGLFHCVRCKSMHQGTRHHVGLNVKALYPDLGLFGGITLSRMQQLIVFVYTIYSSADSCIHK